MSAILIPDAGILHLDIVQDGARNTIISVVGDIDKGDIPPTRIIDIDKLFHEPGYKITRVRIDFVTYFVDIGLTVPLSWEGVPDENGNVYHKPVFNLSGKGRSDHDKMGGRQNTHDDLTGNIMVSTQGFSGKRQQFSIELELIKQFT